MPVNDLGSEVLDESMMIPPVYIGSPIGFVFFRSKTA
jgi:hypothetical protein